MKYQQLNTLIANLNAVIGQQETKTAKKLIKIYEKVKSHHEDYQKQIEDLRLDNASVDEKDCLILNEKGEYKFTKEAIKTLSKQIEELTNKDFDFTPIPVVNPQGLTSFTFLKDWVSGVEFEIEEEEEL